VSRALIAAIVISALGIVAVAFTADLIGQAESAFLRDQRNRILAAEIALFGIVVVELLGQFALQRMKRRNAIHLGIAAQAVLRTVAYLVLGVSIVSILSANPALAIGVGSVTGLVIAFSAQTLIGNVFAGLFLALARPFEIGDEVTVMGVTGRVVEIGSMYTRLDAGERYITIPSSAILTQAVQRRKRPQETVKWPAFFEDLTDEADHR
jgi:small-conductance mechanosensitive channel